MTGRLRAVNSSQRYNDHHRVIFHPSSAVYSAGPQHCRRLSCRLNPAGVACFRAAASFAFPVGLQCTRVTCSCHAAGQLQSAWELGAAFAAVSTLRWRLFEACSLCSQRAISQGGGLAHEWSCEDLPYFPLLSTGCGQKILQNWEQDY